MPAKLDPLVVPARHVVQHDAKGGFGAVESHQVITVGFGVHAGPARQTDVAEKKLEIAHLETTLATRIGIARFVEHQRLRTDEGMKVQCKFNRLRCAV